MTYLRLGLGILIVVVAAGFAAFEMTKPSEGQPQTMDGSQARGPPAIAVVTAVAERRDVAVTRDVVGWVEPIATVTVRPRIDGVIVEQRVSEGAAVKPGDVLYRLDDRAIRAAIARDQAQIDKDQASLDQARRDLAGDQELLSRNVVTKQAAEQQAATVTGLEASVAMDQAALQADQVQLAYTTITAPIAGRVGVVGQTLGNVVRTADETALLTITQMAPVRVSFSIPQRDLHVFRKALDSGKPVAVQAFHAGSEKPLATGKLSFIDSTVDTSSGTVIAKAEFANEDQALWPGEYLTARTELAVINGATVVPRIAVQQTGTGGASVFRVGPDKRIAVTPVTVADAGNGDYAVITAGLKPGDHIVVEGQLNLKDGAVVTETVRPAGTGV